MTQGIVPGWLSGPEDAAAADEVYTLSKEVVRRAVERGLGWNDILDAVRNPLKVTDVVFDKLGRPSQKLIGRTATVVRNTETGLLVTVWRTSSRIVRLLTKVIEP